MLLTNLILSNPKGIPELQSLIAIRHAYWDQPTDELQKLNRDFGKIPLANPKTLNYLTASSEKAENPKSSFLIKSAILFAKLNNTKAWGSES